MAGKEKNGRVLKRFLWTAAVVVLGMAEAVAQTYSIDSYVVAGGGGTSSGGDYTLSGTVGQPSAGTVMSGGEYALQGGFWPGLIVPASGEVPQLYIRVSGQSVTVSWSPAGLGFVLEETSDLAAGAWFPAPAGNPVELPATEASAYYRLHKD